MVGAAYVGCGLALQMSRGGQFPFEFSELGILPCALALSSCAPAHRCSLASAACTMIPPLPQNIRMARDALCALIMGSPAGKVYSRLRNVAARLGGS
jgi:hypothetical protein